MSESPVQMDKIMENWLFENQHNRDESYNWVVTKKNKIPASPNEFIDWLFNNIKVVFVFKNKTYQIEIYTDKDDKLLPKKLYLDIFYYSTEKNEEAIVLNKDRHNFKKYPKVKLDTQHNASIYQILNSFCDLSLKHKYSKNMYKDTNNELSGLFNLPVIEFNYDELRAILKSRNTGKINIHITLDSWEPLSAKVHMNYLSRRKMNDDKVRSLINSRLETTSQTVGRVNKVKSDYQFKMDNSLQITLEVSITYYSHKDYKATYGYFESAIDNLCKAPIGVSLPKLHVIAKELYVDIKGMKDDEICIALRRRFEVLTDQDFEYFINK